MTYLDMMADGIYLDHKQQQYCHQKRRKYIFVYKVITCYPKLMMPPIILPNVSNKKPNRSWV